MNVLFLTQGPEVSPSPRYRVYQLLPLLRKLGIADTVSPVVAQGSLLHRAWNTWGQRRRDLQRLHQFDAVFVQKGVFPGLSARFERQIATQKPVVFDFDDAIWLPRKGGNSILRALHRERSVQSILLCASAVITGNEFLADYARRFNRNVIVVPSAIDVARYPLSISHSSSSRIGWIGSSTTLPYLQPLKPVFKKLRVRPRVIASGDPGILGFEVEFKPWALETELTELAQFGIGIAPLPDRPWERGKCAVKLLQYMACGMAVVASPVGVHNEIIRHGENGLLARSESEWQEHLATLIADGDLRARLGAAARRTVETSYDIRHAAEQVANVLTSLS